MKHVFGFTVLTVLMLLSFNSCASTVVLYFPDSTQMYSACNLADQSGGHATFICTYRNGGAPLESAPFTNFAPNVTIDMNLRDGCGDKWMQYTCQLVQNTSGNYEYQCGEWLFVATFDAPAQAVPTEPRFICP